MTNGKILTDEEIESLVRQWHQMGEDGHSYDDRIRSIKKFILQSSEIQALRKDAERYRTLRKQEIMVSMTYDGNTGATPWISSNELDSCADSLASSME